MVKALKETEVGICNLVLVRELNGPYGSGGGMINGSVFFLEWYMDVNDPQNLTLSMPQI